MNSKKAKSLRRRIYGDKTYRFREYKNMEVNNKLNTDNKIESDDLRQIYQKSKKYKLI